MNTRSSNHNSQTSVIELQPQSLQQDNSSKHSLPPVVRTASRQSQLSRKSTDRYERLPSPITAATDEAPRWNSPTINIYRTFATFWAFIAMGMNDAASGALIPYLETYYNLTYTIISLIFLVPVIGYMTSALLNNTIHMKFGQRGIAVLAPSLKLVAFIVIAIHPPYPALVAAFLFTGFGQGLEDAAWNAWIGPMAKSNEIMGFLHGFYGLGGVLSPLIATTLVTKANLQWYTFYYIMIGMAAIELASSSWAFWASDGAAFRLANARTTNKTENRMKEALFTLPAARITWCCAIFLLGYVGVEVSLGGWIVTFMIRVRQGARFASGMTATGFWLGITIGRVILGFVTPRIGEKLAICIYLPITMGLELLFWLVPQFYVSAVAIGLVGFFMGPLFPAAMVVATRLLPRHLHVSAIGFAAAFGGGGAAIFPFAVGAIASAKGVAVLQPIALALLVAITGVWLCLPRLSKKVE